jgi:hypothetical protein
MERFGGFFSPDLERCELAAPKAACVDGPNIVCIVVAKG